MLRACMFLVYRTRWAQATCLMLLASTAGLGHSSAVLHMRLQPREGYLELHTSIDLHVLREMIEVDGDGDGRMSPEEIKRARPSLAAYLNERLRLSQEGQDCPVELVDDRMINVSALQVLMRARCPTTPRLLSLDCGLLAGSNHRFEMYLDVVTARGVQQLHLDDQHRRVQIHLSMPWSTWQRGVVALGGLAILAAMLAWLSHRRSR